MKSVREITGQTNYRTKLQDSRWAEFARARRHEAKQYDALTFAHALAEFVATPTMVKRYAHAWAAELNDQIAKGG